jgi:hypothetical protein
MSEFERQCYDWGWADSEERIIKLLEEHQPSELGRELGIYPCTCGYDSPEIDLTQHHIALIEGKK